MIKLRLLLVIFGLMQILPACELSDRAKFADEFSKGLPNKLLAFYLGFDSEYQDALEHSIIKGFRGKSDCQPDCPKVDIWKYAYKMPDGTIQESPNPISTLKANWKVPFEARIISLTLFGNQERYLQGLVDYVSTNQIMKEINNISESPWGYETFTYRVYVARRNPTSALPEIERATSDHFIDTILNMGMEVVYVDNGLAKVGLDATFWRFMVAAEPMPAGERLRYIVRDVDWLLSAAEVFSLGEWINSGAKYHRMHILPICVGPLTASIWGGWHEGVPANFANFKEAIENYPYRLFYGDDETFTRDIIWPKMKFNGSVMTHILERDIINLIANPYEGSCEEPTKEYCDKLNPNNTCVDVELPTNMSFDARGSRGDNRRELLLTNSDMSSLQLNTPRGQEAVLGFSSQPLFR